MACLLLFLLLLSLFSFVFISGQNVISISKDTAATAVVVDLIIRTKIVSLLLTSKIVYYLLELPVQ